MSPSCPVESDWPFAVLMLGVVMAPTAIIVASIIARAIAARPPFRCPLCNLSPYRPACTLDACPYPCRTVDPAGLPPLHQPVVDALRCPSCGMGRPCMDTLCMHPARHPIPPWPEVPL